MPYPTRKKAAITAGYGGVTTSIMYARIITASAAINIFARPSLTRRALLKKAARIKPTAWPTKTRDITAKPM
jgi:shikimate 5-dehydrogenase